MNYKRDKWMLAQALNAGVVSAGELAHYIRAVQIIRGGNHGG